MAADVWALVELVVVAIVAIGLVEVVGAVWGHYSPLIIDKLWGAIGGVFVYWHSKRTKG